MMEVEIATKRLQAREISGGEKGHEQEVRRDKDPVLPRSHSQYPNMDAESFHRTREE